MLEGNIIFKHVNYDVGCSFGWFMRLAATHPTL
jgi:hypothetical protein